MKRYLEQTERRDDHRFGDVLGCHWYLMITLHQVYAGEELAALQLVGEVEVAGEGVAVVCRRQVEPAARTIGGGGWYPTSGLICRQRRRAAGRLAALLNGVGGRCTLRQYPP